jgi:hypothetical protein
MRLPFLLALLTVSVLFSPVFAQKTATTEFFPLTELREGMRGTAWTVFRGSTAEEFNVEILGVVPGAIGPKQDLIIGRIGGGQADRTFVFAGMSGSPVYIDGKLVGAISYSFPFAKEPICGITPIAQMIDIFEQKESLKTRSAGPRTVSFAELAAVSWNLELPRRGLAPGSLLTATDPAMTSVAGLSFRPIATPVSFSGFSPETLARFAPQLLDAGLLPVAAAGGAAPITALKSADETTLVGGDSVSMQLTRGDFSMAAAGTVTWRNGEKIYAFGHPFLNLGSSDLPMSESHVVTVVPNVNNSFKLAVPDAMVGSMTQDRSTGVFGKLGVAPKMIPVEIDLETSRGQTQKFTYEVAKDEFLTPLLLNITIYNALIANERSLGEAMIELGGEIRIKGQEPVRLATRLGGMQATQFAALSVALPVNSLLRSNFEGLEISGIKINMTSVDGSKSAALERIAVDRTRIRAGETFEVQAFVRTESGRTFVQRIPVTVPADTPSGPLSVMVGDGNAVQQSSAIQQFVPKNPAELIAMINRMKKSDRLYVQTFRTTNGAVIGANELPNLPPSVLATLNNDRMAGGFKPTVQSIVGEQEIPPAEFIITGQQTLAIEIVR